MAARPDGRILSRPQVVSKGAARAGFCAEGAARSIESGFELCYNGALGRGGDGSQGAEMARTPLDIRRQHHTRRA